MSLLLGELISKVTKFIIGSIDRRLRSGGLSPPPYPDSGRRATSLNPVIEIHMHSIVHNYPSLWASSSDELSTRYHRLPSLSVETQSVLGDSVVAFELPDEGFTWWQACPSDHHRASDVHSNPPKS